MTSTSRSDDDDGRAAPAHGREGDDPQQAEGMRSVRDVKEASTTGGPIGALSVRARSRYAGLLERLSR